MWLRTVQFQDLVSKMDTVSSPVLWRMQTPAPTVSLLCSSGLKHNVRAASAGSLVVGTLTRVLKGVAMIIVRDLFHIQPDQMKKAKELTQEGCEIMRRQGYSSVRVMTDLTGDYYRLVLEGEYKSLADFEAALKKVQANRKWQQFYPKLRKLILGGHREIFTLVG